MFQTEYLYPYKRLEELKTRRSEFSVVLDELKPVVRDVEHHVDERAGIKYINVKAVLQKLNTMLVLREYRQGETLVAYGYYIHIGGLRDGEIVSLITRN